MSMVWRRTPSGELAFNRCPPNATGTDTCNMRHLLFLSVVAFLPSPGDGALQCSCPPHTREGGAKVGHYKRQVDAHNSFC